MKLTLAYVQRCLTGIADAGADDVQINSVQTDSRTVTKGDLFVCIAGENFDGHEFAHMAASKGAVAVIASQMLDDPKAPVIMVRDTVEALGVVAACWRDMCGTKLVAVTGTAGKTTVKEMLFSVVSQKFTAAKNYRNHNNQVGLPLSMLKADCTQDMWIMELGISKSGDMEDLARVACPDLAIITNVGPGHLDGLGDVDGVTMAKTTLLKYLRQGGDAVVSMDYSSLWATARSIVGNPVGFSTSDQPEAFCHAEFIKAESDGWGRFRLRTPDGDGEFSAPFCGEHYAENLACVAAAANKLGLSRDDVIAGVRTVQADPQRFCCKLAGDALVIDDTYNANPLSMARSIRAAVELAGDRPLVLVLGDMRELGAEAAARHEDLGRLIKDAAPEAAFFKGDHLGDVLCGAECDVTETTTPEEFLSQWRERGIEGGVVLFKGSRSLKMEAFANALCHELGAPVEGQGDPK